MIEGMDGQHDSTAREGTHDLGGPGAGAQAGAEPRRPRRHRRVVRPGPETQVVSGLSADETPAGWSESPASREDSNDDQLLRDVPPHW